ncbi:MAG: phosphonate C-P lyase system protein PhnH [Pseudomonadota bacterium]
MTIGATFADPALGAQATFRTLLDALAHPGRPYRLDDVAPRATPPLHAPLYAAALALLDFESPVWLDPALAGRATEDLRFHTGAPAVAEPDRAAFGLVVDATAMPPLTAFAQGTAAFPDRSTTVLVQVDGFDPAGPWRLSGPGLAAPQTLGVNGLPSGFVDQWATNHSTFPLGVDAFCFTADAVVGLPRTTRIEG